MEIKKSIAHMASAPIKSAEITINIWEILAKDLAKALESYEDKPSSDKWAAIQKLAREVLK